jgi:hypothetical protein
MLVKYLFAFREMFVRLSVLMVTVSLVVSPGSEAAQANPRISFEDRAIGVSGATPGGRVVFFGMAQEPYGYSVSYDHHVQTVEADAEGNSRVTLKGDVAPRAVWAVVDITSGGFAIASNYPSSPVSLSRDALKRNGQGEAHEVELPFGMVDILLVRPGIGAWTYFNADGGANDERGHAKGRTRSKVERFSPFNDPDLQPVKHAKKGDVLIFFEPIRMFYYATQVGDK